MKGAQFAPEEADVETLITCVVAAHINKFRGILRVFKKFAAGRAACVVVIQVQQTSAKCRSLM